MPIDLSENKRALAKLAAAGDQSKQPTAVEFPANPTPNTVYEFGPDHGPYTVYEFGPNEGSNTVYEFGPNEGPDTVYEFPANPKDNNRLNQAIQAANQRPAGNKTVNSENKPSEPGLIEKWWNTPSENFEKLPAAPNANAPSRQQLMSAPIVKSVFGDSSVNQPDHVAVAKLLDTLGGGTKPAPSKEPSKQPSKATGSTNPKTGKTSESLGSQANKTSKTNDVNYREQYLRSPMEIAEAKNLELQNQAEYGQQMADAEEAHRVRMQAYDLARKENEEFRQLSLRNAEYKIDESQKEADKFKTQDGGFLSRNPGAILMAIGAIFGGALAARTGRPNESLNALESLINRDIQSQKDILAQKNAKTTGLVNSLGRMKERFKDERAAELAEELSARRDIHDRLEGIVQSSKSQAMRDQGAILLKEGRAREAQLRMEIAQREAATTAARASQERQTQLEFTKMAVQHAYKMAEEGPAKFDKQQQHLKETYVPGYGFAARPEDASKLKAAVAVKNLVSSQIPGIIDAYKDLGPTGRMLDINGEHSALEQKLNVLVGAIKNHITQSGASMTETEKPLNGITVDDIKDWFDVRGRATAKLDTFRKLVDENVNSQLSAASIERGRVVENVPNPYTGEPMPYYVKEGSVLEDIPKVDQVGTKETK